MEKKFYLGYIAHFVKNVDQITQDGENRTSINTYRTFFIKHLGTSNVVDAPDTKIRDLSRHLYRAHVAGLHIRYSPYYLASTLTSKQLADLITGQIALIDTYGLYKPTDEDITISNIDRNIKKMGTDKYRSVLTKYLPQTAQKRSAPKKAVPAKKTVAKKTVAKKVVATKKAVPKGKSCKEHGLPALKQMAKDTGIRGYSKMNKPALCVALGIKA